MVRRLSPHCFELCLRVTGSLIDLNVNRILISSPRIAAKTSARGPIHCWRVSIAVKEIAAIL